MTATLQKPHGPLRVLFRRWLRPITCPASSVTVCTFHKQQNKPHSAWQSAYSSLVRWPYTGLKSKDFVADFSMYIKNPSPCFRPVSNWGPFACKANVITATLRKPHSALQKKKRKRAGWEEPAPDITLAEHGGVCVGAHGPNVS